MLSFGKKSGLLLFAVLTLVLGACVPQPMIPGTGPTPTQSVEEVTPLPTEPVVVETDAPVATENPQGETGVLSVVYIRERNVWLWVEGGSPRQLTNHGQVLDVRLSDDGQIAAYMRSLGDTQYELWAVNADGTNDRVLAGGDFLMGIDPRAFAVAPNYFDWVPGTHRVAFNSRHVFEGPGTIQYNDLNLVDADSGDKFTLLPIGEGGDFYYSPDGAQIALVTSEYIHLVNADGSNRRRVLEFPRVNTASEYAYYPMPIWAEDSSHLLVSIAPADPWVRPAERTRIYNLPTDGTGAIEITSVEALYIPFSQAISSDLEYFLYTHESGTPDAPVRNVRLLRLADLFENPVAGDALVMSSGWLSQNAFTFVGGSPLQAYVETVDLTGPLTLGGEGVRAAVYPGEQGVFAVGTGSSWTLYVEADGTRTEVDTFTGDTPVIDVAD